MEVLPLNALIYNQQKILMQDVIAPPYDVIDKDYQSALYLKSPYNIIRLILSNAENRYEDAKKNFEDWKNNDILIKTEKPVVFYIIQKYKNEKGMTIERKGFIARNKIEDFSKRNILPHEYTMDNPKQERLDLITATGAFFSQIFMVYKDTKKVIEKEVVPKYLNSDPFIDVFDDLGVETIVYIIDNEKDIETIQNVMKNKTLLIADGHHRYEAALKYAKQHPQNEYAQYVMSYFTNAADKNLIIYPTHRIIEKEFSKDTLLKIVAKYYDIEKVNNKNEFLNHIEAESKKQITTGLILKNDANYYILKLKKGQQESINVPMALQNLDLTVLHELILKKELGYSTVELTEQKGIKYEKRETVVFDSIKNGASACFIMAYPKLKDIINISSQNFRMPQKSTYFYPKLLSGIVINPLK